MAVSERGHDFDDKFDKELGDILRDGIQPHEEGDWLDKALTSETENLKPRSIKEIDVKVVGVYEHSDSELNGPPSEKYFVLMSDNGTRRVAIWVGKFEAYSISMAIDHASLDRPMTHDLMSNVISKLGAKVEKILIDDIWQETYYAKITLSTCRGQIDIDSRPSDAIAIALRVNAPIFMAESVLEQSSINDDL